VNSSAINALEVLRLRGLIDRLWANQGGLCGIIVLEQIENAVGDSFASFIEGLCRVDFAGRAFTRAQGCKFRVVIRREELGADNPIARSIRSRRPCRA